MNGDAAALRRKGVEHTLAASAKDVMGHGS
jgi:hypothetical protein